MIARIFIMIEKGYFKRAYVQAEQFRALMYQFANNAPNYIQDLAFQV